jgi:hypothetical protein
MLGMTPIMPGTPISTGPTDRRRSLSSWRGERDVHPPDFLRPIDGAFQEHHQVHITVRLLHASDTRAIEHNASQPCAIERLEECPSLL